MEKPLFEIAIIARNEEITLPRMIGSLKEFQERGGIIRVLDTGSTDKTAEIARNLGCIVEEVGDKFVTVIDEELEKNINQTFIIEDELPIIKAGERLFDFAGARNYLADTCTTNWIACPDSDEIWTKFDIDKINKAIEDGAGQLEYEFVFSHDAFGGEAIKFKHCKFYNRKKLHWIGKIHETLEGSATRVYLDESIIKLEHYQNEKTDRSGYLRGLALDCYMNPDNDRNLHYLMRELMWTKRPKSAIQGFKKHIAMGKWQAEAAQSAVYIGNCYGQLNDPDMQVAAYNRAFYMDTERREALIQLASFYFHNKNWRAVTVYAKAALEIPWTDYYANDMAHYGSYPHFLLYTANGWLQNIDGAKEHILKALEYQPLNSEYLRDYRFYFTLPNISFVIPSLGRLEGLERCITSIKNLNYPENLLEIKVLEGEETVPQKVKKGVEETKGEYICYMANDAEMTPDSLILAIKESIDNRKRLVAFDTGVRNEQGYICEHFLIKRDLIPLLGGEIFCTRMKHVGVDDLLWAKASKLNEAMISKGKVNHYHFSRLGSGIEMDEIYKKGWESELDDRRILKEELGKI